MTKGLVFIFFLIIYTTALSSQAEATSRYTTIIHPIRSRQLWHDKRIEILKRHIAFTEKKNLPITLLLQYDVFKDQEVTRVLQSLKQPNELGLFLEVSEDLATDSFVPYLMGVGDWARPDKVFFSGYEVSERKRMIDRLIRSFKTTFGYMPKSVGAWYIDPVTLTYLEEKYGVAAALMVADQYSTDTYHLWGQYFGFPYFPSRNNTLMPAQTTVNKLTTVISQWALRDPYLSYGVGAWSSTYSLQANDYQGHHQLDTEYFKNLFSLYASANDQKLSQVTVGLEVGQEPEYLPELERQVDFINTEKQQGNIAVVTMGEFADLFREKYQRLSPTATFLQKNDTGQQTFWYMSPWYRVNLILEDGKLFIRDLRVYDENIKERDYFIADSRKVLFRTVTGEIDDLVLKNRKLLLENVHGLWKAEKADTSTLFVLTARGNIPIYFSEKDFSIPDIDFRWRAELQQYWQYYLANFSASILSGLNSLGEVMPSLFYSTIEGSFIVGIPSNHETLLGFQTKPLFFRRFHFPFQILAHFKKFPKLAVKKLVFYDRTIEAKQTQVRYKKSFLIPREDQTLSDLETWEKKDRRRIFENSEYSLWVNER